MFSSIHSQRWIKWFLSPKKYIVNVEVRVGERYTFTDVEVLALTKAEARYKATEKVNDEIEIVIKGMKSLGKVKNINEF